VPQRQACRCSIRALSSGTPGAGVEPPVGSGPRHGPPVTVEFTQEAAKARAAEG
jgi:hypothetical protein